jgi:hypothetical protein
VNKLANVSRIRASDIGLSTTSSRLLEEARTSLQITDCRVEEGRGGVEAWPTDPFPFASRPGEFHPEPLPVGSETGAPV